MKSFRAQVWERVASGMTGLWIQSYEHEEVVEELKQLCIDPERRWRLAVFDVDAGMQILEEGEVAGRSKWFFIPGYFERHESPEGGVSYRRETGKMTKIDKAVRSLPGLNFGVRVEINGEEERPNALLVLKNAHLLIKNPGMIQQLANAIWDGKKVGQHIVILSPVIDIPNELKKLFESGIIEHKLPNREQLDEILTEMAREGEIKEEERDAVLDAATGLTRLEAENAFALSLVQEERITPEAVFQVKANSLKDTAGLNLNTEKVQFSDVGGLTFMKAYCKEILEHRDPNPKYRPRGIMIAGVSGGGKSLFCKALGNEVGRPTLEFDIGSTLGSMLGQSQTQFRAALDKAEAMAPVILMLDEVEKMLAGAGDDSKTSGGVKTEMMGHLLTRMQNWQADVFVVATCNDVSGLLAKFPEFIGRFDDLFFVDYPRGDARLAIWDIHMKDAGLLEPDADLQQMIEEGLIEVPTTADWTGREIEKCVRQARQRGKSVMEVGAKMPLLSTQANETITELRNWASGRCYAAEYEDLYDPKSHGDRLTALLRGSSNGDGPRRRVRRTKKLG